MVVGTRVELGDGDDIAEIAHYTGGDINGGAGFDTVVLTGGANALSGNHLSGIEAVDLGSSERDTPNVISLTTADLLENHDDNGNLWITGQAGDKVALWEGAVKSDEVVQTADGEIFHEYSYTVDNTTYSVLINDELYQNGLGVVI